MLWNYNGRKSNQKFNQKLNQLAEYTGNWTLNKALIRTGLTKPTEADYVFACKPHSDKSFLFKHGECGQIETDISEGLVDYFLSLIRCNLCKIILFKPPKETFDINYTVFVDKQEVPLKCTLPRFHQQSISDIQITVSFGSWSLEMLRASYEAFYGLPNSPCRSMNFLSNKYFSQTEQSWSVIQMLACVLPFTINGIVKLKVAIKSHLEMC